MLESSPPSIDKPLRSAETSVEAQRRLFREVHAEKIQRLKETHDKIYNESNCIDKIKMKLRNFFSWLIYK